MESFRQPGPIERQRLSQLKQAATRASAAMVCEAGSETLPIPSAPSGECRPGGRRRGWQRPREDRGGCATHRPRRDAPGVVTPARAKEARRQACPRPCESVRWRSVQRGCRGRRGQGLSRRGWSVCRCELQIGRILPSDLRCGRARCDRRRPRAPHRFACVTASRERSQRQGRGREIRGATTGRRRRDEERTRPQPASEQQ